MTEEFIVPDTILTDKGRDNQKLTAIRREIEKLNSHLFEHKDIKYDKTFILVIEFLNKYELVDSDLTKDLEVFKKRFEHLFSRFLSLELDMNTLKHDLLNYQMEYENEG